MNVIWNYLRNAPVKVNHSAKLAEQIENQFNLTNIPDNCKGILYKTDKKEEVFVSILELTGTGYTIKSVTDSIWSKIRFDMTRTIEAGLRENKILAAKEFGLGSISYHRWGPVYDKRPLIVGKALVSIMVAPYRCYFTGYYNG
jgi:hypothetical protein